MQRLASKYRAVQTIVDGIRFASKAEARRYVELKCLERAGKIFRLQLQPKYRLCAWARQYPTEKLPPLIGYYVADFRYCNAKGCDCVWGCTIEDVKGMRTPLYRWKKKHFEAQYERQIREIHG